MKWQKNAKKALCIIMAMIVATPVTWVSASANVEVIEESFGKASASDEQMVELPTAEATPMITSEVTPEATMAPEIDELDVEEIDVDIEENSDINEDEKLDAEILEPEVDASAINSRATGTLVATGVCGYSGNNITWDYYNSGELVLKGTGMTQSYYLLDKPWKNYVANIKKVTIGHGITVINSGLFQNHVNLTTVTLPSTLKKLRVGAFGGCSRLASITLPAGLEELSRSVFEGCSSLKSVTIPNGIKTIDGAVFWKCTSLTSVQLPSTLKTIPESMFYGCKSIKSFTLPPALEVLGNQAFAFCNGLETIKFPNTIKEVGREAFGWGTAIKKIEFPASLEKLASNTFWQSNKLEEISFKGNAPILNEDRLSFSTTSRVRVRIPVGATGYTVSPWTDCLVGNYFVIYDTNKGEARTYAQGKLHQQALTLALPKDLPTNPTRTGYDFKGWATSATATAPTHQFGNRYTTNADLKLYAVWTTKKFKISYDANGGSGAPKTQTKEYSKDIKISTTKPVKEGYNFNGWSSSRGLFQGGETYKENRDVVLTARWVIKTYTVTLQPNYKGAKAVTKKKTHGIEVSLLGVGQTGYTLQGWATSANSTKIVYKAGETYKANKDITLYAVWKINTYKVTYYANGAGEDPTPQVKTYGKTLKLSSVVPVKSGYIFEGWATVPAAIKVVYRSGDNFTENKNIVLYGVWRKRNLKGWQIVNGKTYYYNNSGKMLLGWRTIGGKVFYFKKVGANGAKGSMLTGWQTIAGKTFYFKKVGDNGTKGAMLTGWQTISGKRFYFKKVGDKAIKGAMLTGWQTLSGKKYFFKRVGAAGIKGSALANGTYSVDGKKYRFDKNGILIK